MREPRAKEIQTTLTGFKADKPRCTSHIIIITLTIISDQRILIIKIANISLPSIREAEPPLQIYGPRILICVQMVMPDSFS